MATNTPSRLNFLTLPAEIRVKVYREIFTGHFILVSNQAAAEASLDRRYGDSNAMGPVPETITRTLALLREHDFERLSQSTLIRTKISCPTDPLALTQTCRHINQEAALYIAETITLVFGFTKRTTKVEPLVWEGAIQPHHAPCRIPSTYLKHIQYVTLDYPMIRTTDIDNRIIDIEAFPPQLAVRHFSSLKVLHLLCRVTYFLGDSFPTYTEFLESHQKESEEADAVLVADAKEEVTYTGYTESIGWTGAEWVGAMARQKDRRFQILLEKSFPPEYLAYPYKQLTWVVDWDSEKVVSKVWKDIDSRF